MLLVVDDTLFSNGEAEQGSCFSDHQSLVSLRANRFDSTPAMEFNVEHGKKQYLLPFAHAGQVLTEQASDVAKGEHLKSKTILESAKKTVRARM